MNAGRGTSWPRPHLAASTNTSQLSYRARIYSIMATAAPVPFSGLGPKLKAAFAAGVKSGVVHFTESEVEEVDEDGIPVSSHLECGLL